MDSSSGTSQNRHADRCAARPPQRSCRHDRCSPPSLLDSPSAQLTARGRVRARRSLRQGRARRDRCALRALRGRARLSGSATLATARAHTAEIVSLEQHLGVFIERPLQSAVSHLPLVPALLGFAYMSLHLTATAGMLAWVHHSHGERFAVVRTTLVLATAVSLAIYVLYPAAPPRLSGARLRRHGGRRARTSNLSSDALGSLYNPFAAVPSLHFGYALLVGAVGLRARPPPLGAPARRRLPGVHALHDRRHRQPLLLRRGRRRAGGRRVLPRRAARASRAVAARRIRPQDWTTD